MIDALGYERHFIDHVAPVWVALPDPGRFLVPPELADHAARLGIRATPFRVNMSLPPRPNPDRVALVASIGDQKKARRLGYGTFVRLEHGAGQAYLDNVTGSYPGGPGNDDVALFLCPNEYSAAMWRAAYPKARVEVVGSPRLDTLPAREPGSGPTIASAFHWELDAWPETRSAFPHFRRALADLAKRYRVIGHGHPKAIDQLSRHYDRLGIEVVRDFNDVCRLADVYVCDNSSTLFEFAATGRPVVVLNPPWYRRSVSHGLRFWEAAHVGVQCDRPEDLAAAVETALADGPEQQRDREDALAIVYPVRSGAATRAAAAIADWLASRQAVAA